MHYHRLVGKLQKTSMFLIDNFVNSRSTVQGKTINLPVQMKMKKGQFLLLLHTKWKSIDQQNVTGKTHNT